MHTSLSAERSLACACLRHLAHELDRIVTCAESLFLVKTISRVNFGFGIIVIHFQNELRGDIDVSKIAIFSQD